MLGRYCSGRFRGSRVFVATATTKATLDVHEQNLISRAEIDGAAGSTIGREVDPGGVAVFHVPRAVAIVAVVGTQDGARFAIRAIPDGARCSRHIQQHVSGRAVCRVARRLGRSGRSGRCEALAKDVVLFVRLGDRALPIDHGSDRDSSGAAGIADKSAGKAAGDGALARRGHLELVVVVAAELVEYFAVGHPGERDQEGLLA